MPASLPTAPAPKRPTTSPPVSSASPAGRTPASRRRRSSSTPAAAPSPCTSPSTTPRLLAMPTRSFRAAASAWPIAWRGATWRASEAFPTCRPPPPTPRWAPPHDRRSPDRGRPRLPRHSLPSPGPPARRRAGLRRPAGGGAARRRPGAAGPQRLRPPPPWRCTGGHARRPAAAAARAAPRSAPRRHPAYEHGARAAAPRPAGRRHHHSCLRCRRTGGGASSRQPLAPAHRARVSARGAVPMSTTGQSVGGIIGAITGAILGGPTGAIYGANIPRVYGTCPVAGNVVWLEGDKYRVKKKKSGGKGGGSVTTYKIFATFAVVLCEGPIVGLRRLWIGGNLVYDGGATATAGAIASGKSKSLWKLYTGTDTQQPDPRYQADKGVNATSGFPGLAYLVFYDLPLDKYGNSLAGAQVKAEVVTQGTQGWGNFTYVQLPGSSNGGFGTIATYVSSTGAYAFDIKWDGTYAGPWTIDVYYVGTDLSTKLMGNVALGVSGAATALLRQSFDIPAVAINVFGSPSYLRVVEKSGDIVNFSPPSGYWGYSSTAYCITKKGDSLAMGSNSAGKQILVLDYSTGNLKAATAATYTVYDLRFFGTELFALLENGAIAIFDAETLAYVTTISGPAGYPLVTTGSFTVTAAREFLITLNQDLYQYSGGAWTIIYTNTDDHWSGVDGALFVMGNCVIRTGLSGFYGAHFIDAITYALTPTLPLLSAVVQAECLQSNLLTASDIDVTGLAADSVRGFRVSDTGPIRASLEPVSCIG